MKTHFQLSRTGLTAIAAVLALPISAADLPTPVPPPASTKTPHAGDVPPTTATPAADSADLRQLLQRGLFEEEASRDLGKAAASYSSLLSQYDTQRVIAATALFRLAEIRVKQGNPADATTLYQRLLAEFPGHEPLARLSRERLAKLKPEGEPTVVASAPAAPPADPANTPTPEEAAELIRLREIAKNSPDLLHARYLPSDRGARTPLEDAAAKGWVRVATFLLDQGVAFTGNDGQQAPVIGAAAAGHKRMVELLLDRAAKAEPAAVKLMTDDALNVACASGRMAVIKLLLARGADPNFTDNLGRTALFRTFSGPRPFTEIIQVLLEKGANPNLAGSFENSINAKPEKIPPLSLAVQTDLKIVKLLLEKGADPNFDPAFPGQLPLTRAILRSSEEMTALLLEKGAKTDITLTEAPTGYVAPDAQGPLLHVAVHYSPNLARVLLKHGAPKNVVNAQGDTPLQWALRKTALPPPPARALDSVVRNPNQGPQPGGGARFNRTVGPKSPVPPISPEALALLKGLCEDLLTGPDAVDINAPGKTGDTALHLAMQRAELPDDFIRWLISKGADPTLKNNGRQTALEVAEASRAIAYEPEFLFPKIQRKDAIAVLARLPEPRTSEADYLVADNPAANPPSLTSLIVEMLDPDRSLPRQNSNTLRGSFQNTPNNQIVQRFDALVYRADAAGKFSQIGKAAIDHSKPASTETWPTLQWGDVVVFYGEFSTSTIFRSDLRPWLKVGKPIAPEENPAVKAIEALQPAPSVPPKPATPAPPNRDRTRPLPKRN